MGCEQRLDEAFNIRHTGHSARPRNRRRRPLPTRPLAALALVCGLCERQEMHLQVLNTRDHIKMVEKMVDRLGRSMHASFFGGPAANLPPTVLEAPKPPPPSSLTCIIPTYRSRLLSDRDPPGSFLSVAAPLKKGSEGLGGEGEGKSDPF